MCIRDRECSAALHHNKTKTNYHIHLVFSERKMLEQPEVKIATRNMFYDEQYLWYVEIGVWL